MSKSDILYLAYKKDLSMTTDLKKKRSDPR